MKLNQVGKRVRPGNLRGNPTVRIIMGIKAPRGQCFLFASGYGRHQAIEKQCVAVKAFMEEHRNDRNSLR